MCLTVFLCTGGRTLGNRGIFSAPDETLKTVNFLMYPG